MSKELEALNVLYKIALNTNHHYQKKDKETDDYKERVEFHKNIIENALKDYEMEHTLRIRLENINYELVREKEENQKKLKAFEIIKEKISDINWFKCCDSLGRYNASVPSYKQLTQKQYDLLKEVLL